MSAELPLAPPSGRSKGDEVAVGSEPPVRALLEQLIELWGDERHGSAPLHLIFTSLTVTAVLKASDCEVRSPSLLGFSGAILPRQGLGVLFGYQCVLDFSELIQCMRCNSCHPSGITTCSWSENWLTTDT